MSGVTLIVHWLKGINSHMFLEKFRTSGISSGGPTFGHVATFVVTSSALTEKMVIDYIAEEEGTQSGPANRLRTDFQPTPSFRGGVFRSNVIYTLTWGYVKEVLNDPPAD